VSEIDAARAALAQQYGEHGDTYAEQVIETARADVIAAGGGEAELTARLRTLTHSDEDEENDR